ncbi:MAG: bifunctional nuclease family protein [Actinomycetota bacterium]|jgi:bifunctional DNase/RNase|nr:bifunctional nuclease family protein [Actinomycetota bacterium]
MELLGVRLELPANAPVVLLREHGGSRRVLPIYIGQEEAKAIAWALEGVTTPRPMTHDLMRDLLGATGASVQRIVLTELRESTFFAEVEVALAGQVHRVSSRPSDAIALAVRVEAAIFATDEVLDDGATSGDDGRPEEQDQIVDEFRQFIEHVNPEDFS